MTDKSYTSTKPDLIISADKKTGFKVKLILTDNSLIFAMDIASGGSSCIDDDSPIYFLFTDGSRLQLKNGRSFNCDGEAAIYFFNDLDRSDNLEQLSTKKIKAMRITMLKSSVEEDFTNTQATLLMNQLKCLKAAVVKKSETKKDTVPTKTESPKVTIPDNQSPTSENIVVEESKKEIEPIRVISGGVLNGKATSLPKPVYPYRAKKERASGAVNVQVIIDESGKVVEATAISGNELLREAAEAAARVARFAPTLLSGQPVRVKGVVVYNFIP